MRFRQLATGAATNWAAFAVSVASTFILAPFVVRELGETRYGVWVLVTSTMAYLGLLDLGLRGAVTHFVARHHAADEHDAASRAFSATVQLRLAVGVVALVAAAAVPILIPMMFRIPGEHIQEAQWAALAVGTGLVATLTLGVYGGVLAALGRFATLGLITVVQTLLFAGGIAFLLWQQYGIVAIALWQCATVVMQNVAYVWFARRAYPELRLDLRQPLDRVVLRRISSFSVYLVLAQVSSQIIYFSGTVLTGTLISAAAVTTYSIAVRLIDYLRPLVASMAQMFMPITSSLHARQDMAGLQRVLIAGTRAALLLSLPILSVFLFRGETFITLWMGSDHGPASGHILRVLLISTFLHIGNYVAGYIATGMNRHKPFALFQCAEAIANIGLALFLVKELEWGVAGIAWAMTLTNSVQGLLWPVYISRLVSCSLSYLLWQAWARPVVAAVPFALVCAWMDRNWHTGRLDVFFMQIFGALPIYAAGVAAVFHRDLAEQLRNPDSMFQRRLIQPLRLKLAPLAATRPHAD